MVSEIIRVMLADDHHVVRAGLRAILGTAKDIVVVAEAANGSEAVAIAERTHPDVVVMDLSMGEVDGLEATRAILAKAPETRILILTMHDEEEYLAQALGAGAKGYLVKSVADHELVNGVRAVAYGEVYVRAAAAQVLAKRMRSANAAASDRSRFESLTNREREVLRLVAGGYSAPDIGEKLAISPKTVDTYKQRINEKLGLNTRPEYVDFALKLGLLERVR